MSMTNNTLAFFYNNLTMIMMNLEDSIGLIANFENWSEKEDKQVEKLKLLAKENNLRSTLFVITNREMNYGLWNSNNIIKKANEKEIDYVIFYYTNPMINQMPDFDLYKNIEDFLSVRKMIISKDYTDLNHSRFTTSFIEQNWKENAIIIETSVTKDLENNLNLLKKSKFEEFQKLNKLNYQFDARVSEGKKLGRTIGFPTINLITEERIALSYGVYACNVYVDHLKETFLGAGCYWKNELNQDVFEIFLIDFDKEIYGWKVSVSPIEKLRENIKVDSLEELKKLLANDVKTTLKFKK
ncbi:riboflavin kinase [Spiroplasma floricola]|uniref:riboflavin kinase n=1 Tax=Spiroplasma floricola 23-6 TaxID=1336749 RepID=A0A2K8SDU5_9MOLU|nr:riboflavin kinase [Spiroplasma floricola]AUB31634.1 riboflavin kinase / FMN adenylyltransferase [Spiroplasma floricola 23-6]